MNHLNMDLTTVVVYISTKYQSHVHIIYINVTVDFMY